MPKYKDSPRYAFDRPTKLGILLVNLGTPNSTSVGDVRRYLAEFLWDPRVVELPRPLWWLILNGVILRTRPRRSAEAYASVWTEQGSPLMVISREQAEHLQTRLGEDYGDAAVVVLAMRYGAPSIAQGLAKLREANAQRVLVLPLYPQYSATTTAAIFDAVSAELQRQRWIPELRIINRYHDDPRYVAALADSVRAFWAEHERPERLLMSFHGIPVDYALAGDPYPHECQETAKRLADALNLNGDNWQLSFQSRLGGREWLKPYTDETLKKWGADGVRSVHVICPGFSADCLETLEEIAEENREYFIEAGGKDYHYIPALNATPANIEMLAGLVERHTRGWREEA